jgi:hypothetical protein
MRTSLHGAVTRPTVAVVGVWDPMVAAHRDLFGRLAAHAQLHRIASLAIVLDPSPPAMLNGLDRFPTYDDVPSRIRAIRGCGVDGVLVVRFARRDLDGGAAELLDAVGRHVRLRELWLGANQSLGRREAGSASTIERLGAERGFDVSRLEPVRLRTAPINDLLAAGRLAEAGCAVGRPPVRSRPRSGSVRLPWPPGRYQVVPVDHPDGPPVAAPFTVRLEPVGGAFPALAWPDRRIGSLAFLRGPGDDQPRLLAEPLVAEPAFA